MSRFFKRFLLSAAIVCAAGVYSANAQSYLNTPSTYPSINYNSNDLNFAAAKVKQTLFYLSNFYLDTVNVQNVTDEAITKVMQQFKPELMVINMQGIDIGHFEFTSYVNNMRKADYALYKLWEAIQSTPGMANDTVLTAICG